MSFSGACRYDDDNVDGIGDRREESESVHSDSSSSFFDEGDESAWQSDEDTHPHVVAFFDDSFFPENITIRTGESVVWQTMSGGKLLPHPIRFVTKKLAVPIVDPAGSGEHTFCAPGAYAYYLDSKPHVVGTVRVLGNGEKNIVGPDSYLAWNEGWRRGREKDVEETAKAMKMIQESKARQKTDDEILKNCAARLLSRGDVQSCVSPVILRLANKSPASFLSATVKQWKFERDEDDQKRRSEIRKGAHLIASDAEQPKRACDVAGATQALRSPREPSATASASVRKKRKRKKRKKKRAKSSRLVKKVSAACTICKAVPPERIDSTDAPCGIFDPSRAATFLRRRWQWSQQHIRTAERRDVLK